jgi:SAM-dependent methyltransferase
MIAGGSVVAWFHGRMEFGPRGLGARSILADPRRADLRARLNARIKFREADQPFAPSVLLERAPDWFDVPRGYESPYGSAVSPVKEGAKVHNGVASGTKTALPAVTQADGTAPLQTVDAARHPALAGVLRAFEEITGCPILLNTSFNLGPEPIVQSPEDAWRAFLSSGIDALVLENAIVTKSGQRAELEARRKEPSGVERDPALESLLRCPSCGGEFAIDGDRAACKGCAKTFAREEGIWRLFQPSEPFDGDVTQLVKGFYEEHPFPGYDEDESLRSLMDKARKGVYARLLGEQLPSNARALEVGCGTGQLSNFLGIGCRTVVGADLCLNSLRLAEGFRSRHDLRRVRFLQMNLFRPAFAPGSFDVVLCNGVLLTTTDPRAGFESIARLVKPGGHIVIGLYNTYGRLAVDSRRVFFRMTGGRMRWVDPYLRKVRMSAEKEDAWFHDQYRHPHETKQTMGEVLGWFEASGFDFVSAVPKTNPWESFSERESLFTPTSAGTALERGLAQAKMIVTSAQEGGFFIMIGRKRQGA